MALRPTKPLTYLALGGALTMTLAACGGSSDGDDSATGTPSTGASVAAGCEDFAQYGNLKGKTVTVYTGIVTPEDALL